MVAIKLSLKYNKSLQFTVFLFITKFQPLDQGIIANVKAHYKKFMLREIIAQLDQNATFKPNLLQAMRFLKSSWEAVKPETIRNCFREAQFLVNEQVNNCLKIFNFRTLNLSPNPPKNWMNLLNYGTSLKFAKGKQTKAHRFLITSKQMRTLRHLKNLHLKKSFNASPSVSKAKMRVLVKANANILEFSNFVRLFC